MRLQVRSPTSSLGYELKYTTKETFHQAQGTKKTLKVWLQCFPKQTTCSKVQTILNGNFLIRRGRQFATTRFLDRNTIFYKTIITNIKRQT